MADPMTVSVALATFNGERFLAQQLRSLATQRRLPDELVVVDDASQDSTPSLVRDFARAAPFPVRFFSNPQRLGWRANFMRAAELTRGDVIAFCDQDDLWYDRKLCILTDLFAADDHLLAFHDADLIDADATLIGRLRSRDDDLPTRLPRSRPTIWSNPIGLTIAFRRTLLAFNTYWPESIDPCDATMPAAHDQWFYALATNLGTVRYTAERLLGYRQHGGNAVGFSVTGDRRTRPMSWDAGLDPYMDMLDAFCRILERAHVDQVAGFGAEVEAAAKVNRVLLHRLRSNRAAHQDARIAARLSHLGALLRDRAFSRRTPWNLGRTALVKALLVGVPLGR